MARFGKDMVTYAIADLLGSSIGLILSPIFTRLFSVEQYGAQAALAALWSFLGLAQFGGMDSAYPMFRARTADEGARRRLVVTASMVAFAATLTVTALYGLVAISTDWLTTFAGVTRGEVSAYVLTLAPGAIMAWLLYLLRFDRKAAAFARVSLIGRFLGGVALVPALALVGQPQRLALGFIVSAAVTAIAAGIGWWEVRRAGWALVDSRLFDRDEARAMLRYGTVLIPASSLYAASTVADRLLVTWLAGPAETAVLALALRIAAVAVMLRTWFALVWDPQLIDWIATVPRETLWARLQTAMGLIGGVGFIVVAVAVVWTQPVVSLLYPANYSKAIGLVPWMAVGVLISALSLVAVATVTIASRPKFYLPVYAIGLVINIAIGLLAVPRFGAAGAVAGAAAGELVILFCWICLGRFHLKNLPLAWTSGALAIAAATAFAAIYRPGILPGLPVWLERTLLTTLVAGVVAVPVGRKIFRLFRSPA